MPGYATTCDLNTMFLILLSFLLKILLCSCKITLARYVTALCTSFSCSNCSPAPLEGAEALCLSHRAINLQQPWKNKDHCFFTLIIICTVFRSLYLSKLLQASQWITSACSLGFELCTLPTGFCDDQSLCKSDVSCS